MITYNDFIWKWNTRFCDYDGQFGNQCVDLMRQYCKDVFGVDGYKAIPSTGWAKNIFYNFKDNQYFKKVLNGPNNTPKKGDIVFWDTYLFITGREGHVAIVDQADLYYVVAFGQNYGKDKRCSFVKYGSSKLLHGYRGVIGWLTPKK
ncbi:MAG: CHAP domain-containing protein [Chloroflexi bacterium]|nr:CHAP domain-containing protein [Chloroflexota bacterium]